MAKQNIPKDTKQSKSFGQRVKDHAQAAKKGSSAKKSNLDKDDVLRNFPFESFYKEHLDKCSAPDANGEMKALCPFHDDNNPSLGVNTQTGLYYCFSCEAQGDIFQFVERTKAKTFPEALIHLAEYAGLKTPEEYKAPARKELPECEPTKKNLTAEYVYTDSEGEPLFSVFRYEAPGHKKTIRQGHPREGNERPVLKFPEGVERVPYNLVALKEAEQVFVVEGENKVQALQERRLVGTCNPGGAGKWKETYSTYLKDKEVIILPDNDDAGEKHARQVAKSALPYAKTIKIVELPGLGHKEDIIDWFEADAKHNKRLLRRLVDDAEEYASTAENTDKPMFTVKTAADLMNMPVPKWRVQDVLPETGLAALYGPSGAGKSFLVLDMAFSIAEGRRWFGMETKECPVLYVCLESAWGLQRRITAWTKEYGKEPPAKVTFLTDALNLLDEEHVDALIEVAPRRGVVIIDTMNRATPGMDENSGKDMGETIQAASTIQQATEGLVLFVTHTGKDEGKGIRGHSSLVAALDATIEVGRKGNNRFVKSAKVKEGEDGITKSFTLKQVIVGRDEDNKEITSCFVECEGTIDKCNSELTQAQQYGLDSLQKTISVEGEDSVSLEEWRAEFYKGHSGDSQETKKKAFQRARETLVQMKIVHVANDYYSIRRKKNPKNRAPGNRDK